MHKTALIVLTALVFGSCGTSVRLSKSVDFEVDPPNMSEQTKQSVTISMDFANYEENAKDPIYKQSVLAAGLLATEPSELYAEEQIVDPLISKTAFFVRIKNNSDHILRMKDARVALILGDNMDDPIPAYQKQTMLSDLDSYPVVAKYINKGTAMNMAIAESYKEALKKIINNGKFKLINDVSMEIYPDFTVSGLLVFATNPFEATKGKVTFFDVTTKVDAAGNPIEKERFDFAIKPLWKFYKTSKGNQEEIDEATYKQLGGK